METKQVSYLREMLLSNGNIVAALGSVAAGVVLSLPYGFAAGLLPIIGFAAGETIAALFVPYSESFRSKVDRKHRERIRETTRSHLLDEIEQRSQRGKGSLEAYHRMRDRVMSLYRVASDSRTRLSTRDVEKLDDATIDYLRMRLAALIIAERARAVDLKDVESRLQTIERDLAASRPGSDQAQLEKARNDYLSLITRHRRMLSKKMGIEAAILSMPDQMDEIYQTIVTAPNGVDVDSKLAESIAKLGLEEDLEAELEGALRESAPGPAVSKDNRPVNQTRAAMRQTDKH